MNSNNRVFNRVLPNFVTTVLFAAAATLSVSAFAGDKEKAEKIGELKDMKKQTSTLKKEEMKSDLMGEVKKADAEKSEMAEKAEELKAEVPES